MLRPLATAMTKHAIAFGHLLGVADLLVRGGVQVAIAGDPASEAFATFTRAVSLTVGGAQREKAYRTSACHHPGWFMQSHLFPRARHSDLEPGQRTAMSAVFLPCGKSGGPGSQKKSRTAWGRPAGQI